MTISKSFNKITGVYYAYETSYEWDEVKQKKVQKRKCIGRYNPENNEIVPNGKVGRPPKTLESLGNSCRQVQNSDKIAEELSALKKKIYKFEKTLGNIHSLLDEVQALKLEIDRVYNLIK